MGEGQGQLQAEEDTPARPRPLTWREVNGCCVWWQHHGPTPSSLVFFFFISFNFLNGGITHIYKIHPFKVCISGFLVFYKIVPAAPPPNSTVFSLSPKRSLGAKSSRYPPFPALPNSWPPRTYLLSTDLPFLDVSYKRNHVICGLLCLVPFT